MVLGLLAAVPFGLGSAIVLQRLDWLRSGLPLLIASQERAGDLVLPACSSTSASAWCRTS
jgi:hypothetical protein